MSMRMSFAVLFVAVGVLVGLSVRPTRANAQAQPGVWLPFTPGQWVTISADLPDGRIICRVSQVQHGFVGCARDEQRRHGDRWVNLRFVKEITPAERP
jgi:hypothetical protein